MNRFSALTRKITVPHVFTSIFLLLLYFLRRDCYQGLWQLILSLILLVALPLSAYPLQKWIRHYRDRGREGQRSLAMIFSVAGYLFGIVSVYLFPSTPEIKLVFWEYLLCGIAQLLCNKLLHIKASGHACGIVGPVLLAAYFGMYIPACIGALLIVPVYVSSVKTKRHTLGQLIVGSLIPVVCLACIHIVLL